MEIAAALCVHVYWQPFPLKLQNRMQSLALSLEFLLLTSGTAALSHVPHSTFRISSGCGVVGLISHSGRFPSESHREAFGVCVVVMESLGLVCCAILLALAWKAGDLEMLEAQADGNEQTGQAWKLCHQLQQLSKMTVRTAMSKVMYWLMCQWAWKHPDDTQDTSMTSMTRSALKELNLRRPPMTDSHPEEKAEMDLVEMCVLLLKIKQVG